MYELYAFKMQIYCSCCFEAYTFYTIIVEFRFLADHSMPTSHYSDPISQPNLTLNRATNMSLWYRVERTDNITSSLISGYEVFRFGVPMIGEYVNTSGGMNDTISPAVPGAQYRITAWALGNGSRSASPSMLNATTGEASELCLPIQCIKNGKVNSASLKYISLCSQM